MIVVTGGAGFIGSALVAALNQHGESDILVVDELGSDHKWKNLIGKSFKDFIHKDDFLAKLEAGELAGLKAVFHMGACSSTTEQDLDFLIRNNTEYSKRIISYCLKTDARIIYASSAATYGDGSSGYSDSDLEQLKYRPLNGYGFSKQLVDLWAIREGLTDKIAGLKFFNVYGPNEYHKGDMRSVVHKAYEQVQTQGKISLFKSYRSDYAEGEQMRDFVYVKDCADCMIWLLENPEKNGIFNIGAGRARSWNELARAVFAAMNLEPNIEYIDMPESLRGQYQYFTQADLTRITSAGWQGPQYQLEDGVKDYIQSYLTSELLYW